ncbi:MAG: molybdopterin-dependent oxidoreductase [Mangrovicoccus sp.]|nr:molybdopterin-dependent oxidoreductase [Mangrovicoccus sp.]
MARDTQHLPSVKTTCPYCGVGCGVIATPNGAGGLSIKGDPDHPANYGKLCSKGSALGETTGLEERLLAPRVRGVETDWDSALQEVADRFSATIAEHGPDSVAFYVSGQLLTEDYYVANKLMKGFMGSANIDTNSRLCMASTVAGHRRAFGTDTVPGTYEDLESADLVVLAGSNLAWCHPVLYQRLAAAKSSRPDMRVVVIDPRRSATCDLADLHMAVEPGSDVALWNGLLARIAADKLEDRAFLNTHVDGFEAALQAAREDDPAKTGLDPAEIEAFYDLWIGTERVVSVFSQGFNQSSSGSDKVNSLINCHLATGRIGRPGMGPLSVTGQPNAMGGREVGGLANMLACHLDLENAEHRNAVRAFWDAPQMPEAAGLKAVDMFRAVADGRIKALWIMCTNPAVSMPEADAVRDAIAGCDFTVVSDLTAQTDTARLAEIVLPATGWGEKDGTVTNSDRTISRQRGILPAPGQARADWAIMAEIGRRMGWEQAFDYASPAEVFDEYAALSGIAGRLGRDFDISGLTGITREAYDALPPTRWPITDSRKGGRFFGDGKFFTPSGRAQMLALSHRPPEAKASPAYPFCLNTGRVRDHWHTMTRTGLSPRLSAHTAEPFVEVHPEDAAKLGLEPAQIGEIKSPVGRSLARVLITDRVQPGQLFAPIHWTGETSSEGRVDAVVPGVTDPVSGQPESKAARVALTAWPAAWFGFGVSLSEPKPQSGYWAKARLRQGWQVECADLVLPGDFEAIARQMFGLEDSAQAVSMIDPTRGSARIAFHQDGRLVAALYAGPEPVALSRSFVGGALGQDQSPDILAGMAASDAGDPGATVCACLGIGANTIIEAILGQNLVEVAQVTAALGAGGVCGSCRPEIGTLIAKSQVKLAAE